MSNKLIPSFIFDKVNALNIEDITWPRRDTKFLFKQCSVLEEIFRISKRPCDVLFII